jgi:hypothetical protein
VVVFGLGVFFACSFEFVEYFLFEVFVSFYFEFISGGRGGTVGFFLYTVDGFFGGGLFELSCLPGLEKVVGMFVGFVSGAHHEFVFRIDGLVDGEEVVLIFFIEGGFFFGFFMGFFFAYVEV